MDVITTSDVPKLLGLKRMALFKKPLVATPQNREYIQDNGHMQANDVSTSLHAPTTSGCTKVTRIQASILNEAIRGYLHCKIEVTFKIMDTCKIVMHPLQYYSK